MFIKVIIILILLSVNNVSADSEKFLVPVRQFFEKSGYVVNWIPESQEVEVLNSSNDIIFKLGEGENKIPITYINGKTYFEKEHFQFDSFDSNLEKNNIIQLVDDESKIKDVGDIIADFIYVKNGIIKSFHQELSKDKNTIILFWARWCPNCNEVINLLSKNSEFSDYEVITINIDEEPQFSDDYIVFNDINEEIFLSFSGEYIPTAYIVNIDKEVVKIIIGGEKIVSFLSHLEK